MKMNALLFTLLTACILFSCQSYESPVATGGGGGDMGKIELEVIPSKIFPGELVVAEATVTDGSGNPVEGETVTFTSSYNSNVITKKTNSEGKAITGSFFNGPIGTYTVTASVSGDYDPSSDTDSLDVVDGLKLTADKEKVCSNQTINLTATLLSGEEGVTVSFSAAPGNWSDTAVTDGNGVATTTFDPSPGDEYTITATANGLSDSVQVTGIWIDIENTPVKICKGKTSYTINLTGDSETGGEDVEWSGAPGNDNGNSFVINPSQLGEGIYTITAAVGQCEDSVQIKVTTWQCLHDDEDDFSINPGITAEQIKDMGNLDEFEANFNALTDDLEQAIKDIIDASEWEELEDAWGFNPAITFINWFNERLEEMKDIIREEIDDQIESAQNNLSDQIDEFSQKAAQKINQNFALEGTAKATYAHQCDEFDPGNPGWSAPEMLPLNVEEIQVNVQIGFAVNIALQPAGVGIGSLPVKAQGEIVCTASLTGFHGSPGAWQPSPQNPTVTSNSKMNLAYNISGKVVSEALVQLSFGAAVGGNMGFPPNGFDIEMSANQGDCDHVLPWTP